MAILSNQCVLTTGRLRYWIACFVASLEYLSKNLTAAYR
jgi:hypothetical protein